jgi:hypothetical protein
MYLENFKIYGNSATQQIKYYPLLLIIVLFGGLVYNFYRSTKIATKLWAGTWKTAHQIELRSLH